MNTNNIEPKVANRRLSRRCKARSTVKLECRKGWMGLGANVATTLMDVSETGVRVVVSQELVLRQDVEIILAGYGMKQAIKRIGKVCWQLKLDDGKFCVGLAFEKRLPYAEWQSIASPS